MKKDLLPEELTTEQQLRRRTLKAFAWFGLVSLVPIGVWKWIAAQPKAAGIRKPLRQVLDANINLNGAYFSDTHLAPTFPKGLAAKQVRVNGRDGLKSTIDLTTWRLRVEQPGKSALEFTLDDLKDLPKQDLIFDFKCVEGWSQIQHWGGVRFSDFVKKYGLDSTSKYVGMETPDRGYYVGLDMQSALHPQTLLAFEMNGAPLTTEHGAPLRLIIPVKYGVKNLKRIGTIRFADARPRDYWAERGYDYDLAL
ncbi:MAG: molybdopterin-dependent oxidoreductase [Cytophagaceae bacterium]|nr:molybdopterin-dependent oxidoreductase [Cytophagaceae bacterium]